MSATYTASMSISGSLFSNLCDCYTLGLEQQLKHTGVRNGINGYCDAGFAAYPLAVATWEAFLNETLLSQMSRIAYKDSTLWYLPEEIVDKMEILNKTLLFPQFLFGRTFDKGAMPFQDFQRLVAVRNTIIHFHMDNPTGKISNILAEHGKHGIFLVAPQSTVSGADYPWPAKFACTEGIRWSINTVASMVAKLATLSDGRIGYLDAAPPYMKSISKQQAEKWFTEHGLDPNGNEP